MRPNTSPSIDAAARIPNLRAERPVEEPTEEELLCHRRDDDHDEAGGHERQRALVRAEVIRHGLLALGREEDRVQDHEGEEAAEAGGRPADRRPEARAPKAEVPGARAARAVRQEDGRPGQDRRLEERQDEHEPGRRVLDVRAGGRRDDPGDDRDHERDGEAREEPDGRVPGRPARGGSGCPSGSSGGSGGCPPCGTTWVCGVRAQAGQITDGTSSSEATFGTPAGGSGRTPCRSSSATRMPAARAPSTSPSGESPTWNASPAVAARLPRAPHGTRPGRAWRRPRPPTTPRRRGTARGRCARGPRAATRPSCSPRPRAPARRFSSRSSGSASGNARNRSAASIASRAVAWSSPSSASAPAYLLRAAVAELLDRRHVAALDVVGEVVADLRRERRARALLAHIDAGAALELLAQRGRRRLELDQRAEHVEQDGPHLAHEIHSHAANCVVNRPSPTADAAVTGTRPAALLAHERKPHEQREQNGEEARQGHQRLRADRVGQRQGQRGEGVRTVCARQPAGRRRRRRRRRTRGSRTGAG